MHKHQIRWAPPSTSSKTSSSLFLAEICLPLNFPIMACVFFFFLFCWSSPSTRHHRAYTKTHLHCVTLAVINDKMVISALLVSSWVGSIVVATQTPIAFAYPIRYRRFLFSGVVVRFWRKLFFFPCVSVFAVGECKSFLWHAGCYSCFRQTNAIVCSSCESRSRCRRELASERLRFGTVINVRRVSSCWLCIIIFVFAQILYVFSPFDGGCLAACVCVWHRMIATNEI